jgi:hypothetical protein
MTDILYLDKGNETLEIQYLNCETDQGFQTQTTFSENGIIECIIADPPRVAGLRGTVRQVSGASLQSNSNLITLIYIDS